MESEVFLHSNTMNKQKKEDSQEDLEFSAFLRRIPKRFWDDMDWGRTHLSEISKKHKNKWVAIYNKKVIVSDKDLGITEDRALSITKGEPTPIIFADGGSHVYQIAF
ncbi:MAG: DUF5678 domain-containing protein [Methanosarcinales archaeon]